MKNRHGLIIGYILTSICLLPLSTWAVEYRLRVVNLDYLTLSAHLEPTTPAMPTGHRAASPKTSVTGLDFAAGSAIPGRQVQLLEDPRYGGTPPGRLAILPATRDQAWSTVVWEGSPGDTTAFVIKSETRAWQELFLVAAETQGVFRALSIGGPGLFGGQRGEVPSISSDFLRDALNRGTFRSWLERNTKAIDGMMVVVGRGRSQIYDADQVYAVITLPPEPRTFTLGLGWQNHSRPGGD